jgi:hypothetical protein
LKQITLNAAATTVAFTSDIRTKAIVNLTGVADYGTAMAGEIAAPNYATYLDRIADLDRITEISFTVEDISSSLPSADVAACLYLLEQMDAVATPGHLYH